MRAAATASDTARPERRTDRRAPALGAPARSASPTPAQALTLQRMVGNRVVPRVLARWAKHPDDEKKGVMVPDVVAAEFLRTNPPKNA